jgi:hypothetical protein
MMYSFSPLFCANTSIAIVFHQDTCYTQTIKAYLSVSNPEREVSSVHGSFSLPVDCIYPANQSVPQVCTQRKCRTVPLHVQHSGEYILLECREERSMEQEISFSALLRRFRKAYHYNCTQAEIAEKFGYSEETIRSWELGRGS